MFKQFLGAASVATLMALGTLTYAQTSGQGSAGASTSGSTAAQPSGSPTGVSGSAGAGGSVGATTSSAKCDTLMGAEKDRCLAEPRGAGAGVSGTTSGSVITPSTPSVSGSAGAGATVGSTRCDSMNGSEKERCIREEGSASGSTGTRIPDAGNTGMGTDKPKQQ